MSAFNAKNLTYDKNEPAFLRKLRGEYGSDDRHNVQIARPQKARLKTGDGEEDKPTIVNESGETLAKGEWEKMLKDEKDGVVRDEDVGEDEGEGERDPEAGKKIQREKQKIAEVGLGKKRKVVKVVGGGDERDVGDDEHGHDDEDVKRKNRRVGNSKGATETKEVEKQREKQKERGDAIKKKGKKIKLSFGDPEDGG